MKPMKKIGLRRETEPVRLNVRRPDTAAAAGPESRIDLDRIVWDPEYRDQVLEDMKMTG